MTIRLRLAPAAAGLWLLAVAAVAGLWLLASAVAAVAAVAAAAAAGASDASSTSGAGDSFERPGNFNPIVPGYFADPTIEKFGDTFYLYATTDGNGGGRGPATVWVSEDFASWVLVPMSWPATPHYWAPDVVRRPDGRYYLFYNQPCNTYAGVSDAPIGPWTPLTPGDGLVIRDRLIKNVITLDTQIFEDTDGTLYAYWGTWGIFPDSGCGIGVLRGDMESFERFAMIIPNTQAKDFFEAPFMIERGAFLFKIVPGDFVVEASVADYAGLAARRVPGNNDGGLMARAADVDDAGPGEDLVQLGFFPIWNQGNMVTSLDGGSRPQRGNQLAWNAHRHLQIIRRGALFHFRTSAGGKEWQEMPGSPLERADMKDLPLQVGLYHASYGGESSHVSFDRFRLTVRK